MNTQTIGKVGKPYMPPRLIKRSVLSEVAAQVGTPPK
jgi:hypothetical protein